VLSVKGLGDYRGLIFHDEACSIYGIPAAGIVDESRDCKRKSRHWAGFSRNA
jgi:hypothetical protein